jgi:NAD(P)-dependent dehydrogenase (short-subunit alcohol dehydrogenase family)
MMKIGEEELPRARCTRLQKALPASLCRIVLGSAPVATETPLLPSFLGPAPGQREKFVASVPLGRLALVEDVANAALVLASKDAEFVTGNIVEVDGGRCE